MNEAQIHLALNHVPLFFSLIGGIILVLSFFFKNDSYKTLAYYLLVAAAVFTAPVFLTGEGTEELVEKLPGVSESAINAHEEMAETALIVIIVTGVLSLIGILFNKVTAVKKYISIAALVMAFASFGTMAQTAHLGGLIRHTELGNATVQNGQNNDKADTEEHKKATTTNTGEKSKDEDD